MYLIFNKKDYGSKEPVAIVAEESVAKNLSEKIGSSYEPIKTVCGETMNYILDKSYFEFIFSKNGEFVSSKQVCYPKTATIDHKYSCSEGFATIYCWSKSIEEALTISHKCLPILTKDWKLEHGIILKDSFTKLAYYGNT